LIPSASSDSHIHSSSASSSSVPHFCTGCGALLQTKHAKKPGFMSPERMEKLKKAKAEAKQAKEAGMTCCD
jgi:hypothetical protein